MFLHCIAYGASGLVPMGAVSILAMKKHLLAIALFALCTTGLNAASPKKVAPEKKGVETINRATAEAHIGFLACDELEGREAGWKGGRIAGNYIISCLKQMGIKPLDGDYIQPFDVYHAERQVKGKRWQVHPDSIAELKKVVYQKLALRNFLGKIEGKNPFSSPSQKAKITVRSGCSPVARKARATCNTA